MISESFKTKGDLERWVPEIKRDDYFKLLHQVWEPIMGKNLSFIVKSAKDNSILSVALNYDYKDELNFRINSKLDILTDFMDFLEEPIRDERLPEGKNKVFHTFMMATSEALGPAENIILMKFMEKKCQEIAKRNSFIGLFTTNSSPLTQVSISLFLIAMISHT